MNEMTQTIYLHGKLLLSIVQEGVAEKLVEVTKASGARGGTILVGRGVARNAILNMLGLGDSRKEIVLTVLEDQAVEPVVEAVARFKREKALACGISMLIDLSHVLRHISTATSTDISEVTKRRSTSMDSPHTLITCIVNKGAADEVMDAARSAGASGGTILNARGTGKEEDAKFFGIQLVPEKEMLLILVGSGQTGAVLNAIRAVPCLAQPGSGIAFCTDVERFMTLGGKS